MSSLSSAWGEIGAAVTLAAVIWGVGRKVYPWLRKLVHFLDDITGEDARPGRPKRPGLLERQGDLEDAVADIRHAVQELRPNHGSSVKDQLTRIEVQTTALQLVLEQHLSLAHDAEHEIRAALDELRHKVEQ